MPRSPERQFIGEMKKIAKESAEELEKQDSVLSDKQREQREAIDSTIRERERLAHALKEHLLKNRLALTQKKEAHAEAKNLIKGEEDSSVLLQKLILIAEKESFAFAVEVAKKTNNPHVIDALHDLLSRMILEGYFE